jgi:hypothetical protein
MYFVESWMRGYVTGGLILGGLIVAAQFGAEAEPQGCGATVIHTHTNKVSKKGKKVPERTVEVRAGADDGGIAFYLSKMAIDADGAPNAYHPVESKGLDALSSAGFGNSCNVLVCKVEGEPKQGYVTTPDGPFAGFFVSMSSLKDLTKKREDHTRYVSATHVPYVAVAGSVAKKLKLVPGDLAYGVNLKNGQRSGAIFADVGTENTLGEASIAFAEKLKVPSSPKTGGAGYQIFYVVFPNSAASPPWPRNVDELMKTATEKFEKWGGINRVKACEPTAAKGLT